MGDAVEGGEDGCGVGAVAVRAFAFLIDGDAGAAEFGVVVEGKVEEGGAGCFSFDGEGRFDEEISRGGAVRVFADSDGGEIGVRDFAVDGC